MEHGRITGNDCDADSMDSFAHPVNPGICTKYAEEPRTFWISSRIFIASCSVSTNLPMATSSGEVSS